MASGGSVSSSSARGSSGALSRAARRASRLEGAEQRHQRWPCHSRATAAATTAPVCASVPGVGLISRSSAKPLRCMKAATAVKAGSGSPA